MSKKVRVGVLFGGKSAEHEVSLLSARNVIDAIPRDKYEVVPIGIDKQGRWHLAHDLQFLAAAHDPRDARLDGTSNNVALVPGRESQLVSLENADAPDRAIDVVFPVLHGPLGEDGTVQGLLKLADIPFVGASVLGSAIGMDKDVMKRLLRDAGIPISRFKSFHSAARAIEAYADVERDLGIPCFIKPANLGSSVGIHKAHNRDEYQRGIEDAFLYDRKVLVEEFIQCREIECSVLGNEDPIASVPGEVIPTHEFYDYEAKYIDENGANFQIPAKLSPDITKRVQELAVESFRVLCCEGMARVDSFVRGESEVFINEINTIPGFTKISMYPKMWEASGISYTELVDRLIQLALDRHAKEKRLRTSVEL
jgi:D-alanine-D-alanine ligase